MDAAGRADGAVAVVGDPLVVLHAQEVVVAGQLQPALVDLGALAVADRRVVADHDVVHDREREPDRKVGRRALIAVLAGEWPAAIPSSKRVHLLGQHDVGEPVRRHAGRLARRRPAWRARGPG